MADDKPAGMLEPYRVLDLTDEKGPLCGRLLADLGADVIKVEPPGGDPARRIGPFLGDDTDPEKSLFWWAYNAGKRGITLDIETNDGRSSFLELVKTADFVIESFDPGYLDSLGLGYAALAAANPRVILVSITPFGQDGPYRDYCAPDIVAWAMSGQMLTVGGLDLPPVRIGHHSQSHLNAAADGAVGAMVALHQRLATGVGDHVDVSVHDCMSQSSFATTSSWDMMGAIRLRGEIAGGLAIKLRQTWPCRDGSVIWIR